MPLQNLTPPAIPELAPHMGRVEGGWAYIWLSYGLAWVALLAYAFYLLHLHNQLKTPPPENRPPPPSPPGEGL